MRGQAKSPLPPTHMGRKTIKLKARKRESGSNELKKGTSKKWLRSHLLTEREFSVGLRSEEKLECQHAAEQEDQAKRLPNLTRVMFNPWHKGNEASNYLKTVLTSGKVAPQ